MTYAYLHSFITQSSLFSPCFCEIYSQIQCKSLPACTSNGTQAWHKEGAILSCPPPSCTQEVWKFLGCCWQLDGNGILSIWLFLLLSSFTFLRFCVGCQSHGCKLLPVVRSCEMFLWEKKVRRTSTRFFACFRMQDLQFRREKKRIILAKFRLKVPYKYWHVDKCTDTRWLAGWFDE